MAATGQCLQCGAIGELALSANTGLSFSHRKKWVQNTQIGNREDSGLRA